MKKENSSISIVSNVFTVVVTLILLISFFFMVYNQYQTNKRVLDTLSYLHPSEQPSSDSINIDMPDTTDPTDVTITTSETMPHNLPMNTSTESISAVEYSSAIAYLSKIQEVSSINNSSSLLALVYTIISSLILTYGARMLRLGENDKGKLVQELSEKSRQDISDIEKRVSINSSISNVVVTVNSATSLLQLLLLYLPNGAQIELETINASFMDSLSTIRTQLSMAKDLIRHDNIRNIDISSLDCALILFEQNFEVYKTKTLPNCINDRKTASEIVDKFKTIYSEITNMQVMS